MKTLQKLLQAIFIILSFELVPSFQNLSFAAEIPQAEIIRIKDPTVNGKKLALSKRCGWQEESDGRVVRSVYRCYRLSAQERAICDFMGLGKPAPNSFSINVTPSNEDYDNDFGPDLPAVKITCSRIYDLEMDPSECFANQVTVDFSHTTDVWFTEVACYKK